jgi:hypothetical protein
MKIQGNVIISNGAVCPNIKPASTDRGCSGFFSPAALEQAQIPQKEKARSPSVTRLFS